MYFFKKITLQFNPSGAEVFYQVPLQILLLLVAVSKTSTTGGLEAFFEQASFMGIMMDPLCLQLWHILSPV